jgi:hypothetical protein
MAEPTFAIRLLDSACAEIEQPRDWQPALIWIDAPSEHWQAVRVTIQEVAVPVSLRLIDGAPAIVADWPRSGPGCYRVTAQLGNQVIRRLLTVQPSKISSDAYRELLADLEQRLPVAVALGLQRAGGLAGLVLPPPGETTAAQEATRLRRALLGTGTRPGLLSVLETLAADYHVVLAQHEIWAHAERARRPHPARLRQALTAVDNLDANRRPLRVLDDRVDPSVDTYENRLVALFAEQVRGRLRRLVRHLDAQSPLHAELAVLQQRLIRARRQARFLDDVSKTVSIPDRTTMVLLKRPPYRAALAGFLELHRSIAVHFEDPALDSPLENLPLLYQIWGTLRVIAELVDLAVEAGYRLESQSLVSRDADGIFVRVLRDGRPAAVLHHPDSQTVLRCIPERTYHASGPLRSISYEQRPDIAIEITQPGAPPRVLIFDPKYKLDGEVIDGDPGDGKPKKIDIDKMHAYRDAIRDASGNRVVLSAATLYPGPTVHYADGLAAIQAYPGSTGTFEDEVRRTLRFAILP